MINFELSDEQLLLLQEKEAIHLQTCPYRDDGTSPESKSGAIGGAETYCFTPTSIGVIVEVKCACGCEIDLTDYSQWQEKYENY